jgi:hypothetical protein
MSTEDDGVKYEIRTVKSVRGMESRTAAKWESQGWKVVDQKVGRVSSEITLRRPKPKTPWKLYAGLGGFIVVLFIFLIVMNLVTGGENADAEPSSTPTRSAPAEASADPSETATASPTPSNSAPAASVNVVDTTPDELFDRLNSADMGGIQVGDQFRFAGELSGSEYWFVGATGDFVVNVAVLGGANDLQVLLADESTASSWTDGTRVEMVVENVEKTLDGESTDGWLQLVSSKVAP